MRKQLKKSARTALKIVTTMPLVAVCTMCVVVAGVVNAKSSTEAPLDRL